MAKLTLDEQILAINAYDVEVSYWELGEPTATLPGQTWINVTSGVVPIGTTMVPVHRYADAKTVREALGPLYNGVATTLWSDTVENALKIIRSHGLNAALEEVEAYRKKSKYRTILAQTPTWVNAPVVAPAVLGTLPAKDTMLLVLRDLVKRRLVRTKAFDDWLKQYEALGGKIGDI